MYIILYNPKKPSILIINLQWTGQSPRILHHVVGGAVSLQRTRKKEQQGRVLLCAQNSLPKITDVLLQSPQQNRTAPSPLTWL